MRDAEATIEKILKNSGDLFNTQGYKATSLSDITDSTGLTKGAIYRHFDNKDQLEVKALRFLANEMYSRLGELIKKENNAIDKLFAVFDFYKSYVINTPIKGGCPLLNVSIEADDTSQVLRDEAIIILKTLKESVEQILENGIKYKQIKPGINKGHFATLIIASLEGAIMMSKLTRNNKDMSIIIDHLKNQVEEIKL